MDNTTFLKSVCIEALQAAKKTILSTNNTVIQDRNNIQTAVDLASQNTITKILTEHAISCRIFSEEVEKPILIGDGKYDIVIDPLDGSHFFLKGVKAFSSIALSVLHNNTVKYAFVLSLSEDKLYWCDEEKAYLNDQSLFIQDIPQMDSSLLIAGYATTIQRLADYSMKLYTIQEKIQYLNYGGPLLSAMVASGIIDASIEFTPVSLYEMAGAFIAEKAGAYVATIEDKPLIIDPIVQQTVIVARSKSIIAKIQKVFQK